MARQERQTVVTQPPRPISGQEIQQMRVNLGLTQASLSALLHLLGGVGPARSTIARIEGRDEAPAEWTMILRLLNRFRKVKRSQRTIHIETLAEFRESKAETVHALAGQPAAKGTEQVDAEWKAYALSIVKKGKSLAPEVLVGVDDAGFLLELAAHDAQLVAEYALLAGYGPAERRRSANDEARGATAEET